MTCLATLDHELGQDPRTCRNNRLIRRIMQSRMYADLNNLYCIGLTVADEVSGLFVTSNELNDSRFEVLSKSDGDRACQLFVEAAR